MSWLIVLIALVVGGVVGYRYRALIQTLLVHRSDWQKWPDARLKAHAVDQVAILRKLIETEQSDPDAFRDCLATLETLATDTLPGYLQERTRLIEYTYLIRRALTRQWGDTAHNIVAAKRRAQTQNTLDKLEQRIAALEKGIQAILYELNDSLADFLLALNMDTDPSELERQLLENRRRILESGKEALDAQRNHLQSAVALLDLASQIDELEPEATCTTLPPNPPSVSDHQSSYQDDVRTRTDDESEKVIVSSFEVVSASVRSSGRG